MNVVTQSNYARMLNVSRECINDKIKRGLIPVVLINNRKMIDLDSCNPKDYINNRIRELELEIEELKIRRDKIIVL